MLQRLSMHPESLVYNIGMSEYVAICLTRIQLLCLRPHHHNFLHLCVAVMQKPPLSIAPQLNLSTQLNAQLFHYNKMRHSEPPVCFLVVSGDKNMYMSGSMCAVVCWLTIQNE